MWIAMDSLATSFRRSERKRRLGWLRSTPVGWWLVSGIILLNISLIYTGIYWDILGYIGIYWDILGYTVSWGFYTVQNPNISQYIPITEGVWTLLNLFHLVPIYVYLYYLCGRIGCWIVVIWIFFFRGISSLIITKHSPKMGVWNWSNPSKLPFDGGYRGHGFYRLIFGWAHVWTNPNSVLLFTSQHDDYSGCMFKIQDMNYRRIEFWSTTIWPCNEELKFLHFALSTWGGKPQDIFK